MLLQMVSFSLDPQWGGLLLSLYCHHERTADAFAVSSVPGPPLDSDWIAFAGNFGVEICRLSSAWALVWDTVKAGGVILLVGFGSFICYKMYQLYGPRPRSRSDSPQESPVNMRSFFPKDNSLIEELDDEDGSSIEGCYFGPRCSGNEGIFPTQNNCRIKRRTTFKDCKSISPVEVSYAMINHPHSSGKLNKKNFRINKQIIKCSGKSDSPNHQKMLTDEDIWNFDKKLKCPLYEPQPQLKKSFLPFSAEDNTSEISDPLNSLPRGSSFDSICSDLSLDFTISVNESTNGDSTICKMDNLLQEIDQLKSNCQMMNDDFETIRSTRNLPGLSNLMNPVKLETTSSNENLKDELCSNQEKARACFTGLYTLTTINNSISSDLSDSLPHVGNGDDSSESLEWDYVPVKSPSKSEHNTSVNAEKHPSDLISSASDIDERQVVPQSDITCDSESSDDKVSALTSCKTLRRNLSEDVLTQSLDWDEEDMADSILFESSELELPEDKNESCYNVWEGLLTTLNSEHRKEISISRHGVERIWDDMSSADMSTSGVSQLSTPISENMSCSIATPDDMSASHQPNQVHNIGPKVNILKYALKEWRGHTNKAETILKGYAEIPTLFGTECIRIIRGDNYCGVRSTIYQILRNRISVPSGVQVFKTLATAFKNLRYTWLEDWGFARRLPYHENNKTLHGMEICLRCLDNLSCLLSTSQDPGDSLATILNSDSSLDIHVMEAVKLHMLKCAIDLFEAYENGEDVPLFAILMFARDSSTCPQDLMRYHLQEVGNSGGLEQVEMHLLGYTFGVNIRVARPANYGKEDFLTSYPDCNLGVRPDVLLVAEDDRHYNVLVN